MADRYYFYLERDNAFKAIVKQDDVAVDLSDVTKVELTFDGTTYSYDDYPTAFDWDTGTTGEIAFYLGKIDSDDLVAARDKHAEIAVFDATNTQGIVYSRDMDITALEVE